MTSALQDGNLDQVAGPGLEKSQPRSVWALLVGGWPGAPILWKSGSPARNVDPVQCQDMSTAQWIGAAI